MHSSSFFTVGGTVQAGGGKYIHRQVDDELMGLCLSGTFGFVLTARQMGKSSLMVRTAERLAHEGVRSVVIDLSQLGVQVTPDAWYLGLLTRIEDALDLETDAFEWWEDHDHLGLTQRLTEFFQHVLETEVQERVVIFIDEIDSTLSLDFTDDFFAAIRYVYNARSQVSTFDRLTFVLIGVASPNDLISDPQRTPFNIGSQVDVGYFSLNEALPLSEGFDLPPERSEEVLSWILQWTGGHPYLTQRLCSTAASRGKATVTREELDRIVVETFFGQKSEEDSNLRFVQDMVVRRAPDRQAVLGIYERIVKGRKVADDKASQPIAHLKLSGIVARANGSLEVSNRIYGEVFDTGWVKSQWPEHWIRRVPPAVMGLVAASFVAVIALGLLFFQAQQAAQAQKQSEIQAALNEQLSYQIAVADSLRLEEEAANVQLSEQFVVTDSLRLEQEAANQQLVSQIRLSDQLRAESEKLRLEALAANEQLSEQNNVSDSLREVAESLLDAARAERMETITIALASHSARQIRLGDPELGALLARQAYLFSEQGQGQFVAPVHDALRESLDELGLGPPLANVQNTAGVRSVAFSSSGNELAWADENGSVVVAAMTDAGFVQTVLRSQGGAVRSISFTPRAGSSALVVGGDDGRVRIWEDPLDAAVEPVDLGSHKSGVWSVRFSPDGSHVATAGADHAIKVWLIDGPAETTVLKMVAVEKTHDGKATVVDSQFTISMAAAYYQSRVDQLKWEEWRRAVSEDASMVPGPDIGSSVINQLSWAESMIDYYLADRAALSNALLTLDTRTGEVDEARIRALEFSPDGRIIAAAREDGTLLTWPWRDATRRPSIWNSDQGRAQALAFSPDGGVLATGGTTSNVKLWSFSETLGIASQLPILLQGHEGPINALAFSPDGSKLASGSSDHSVQVWDVSRPEQSPILLQGHDSWVWSVAFRPDGATLASAGADRQVATWFVDLERMAERVCEATSRDLTRDEWNRFVGLDVPYDDNYESCLRTAGVND